MKRKSAYFRILVICTILFALTSCALKEQPADKYRQDSLLLDSIKNQTQQKTLGFENESPLLSAFYQIPAPDEVLVVFNGTKKTFKQKLLQSTENYKKLLDAPNQAINFGSYSADLAYCISSNQFQISAKYYSVVRKLAENLGISTVFDKEMLNRIENNINNLDTLQKISNETYYRVIDHLIELDNGKTLIYITVGGFVEAIYIMCNAADGYVPNAPQNQQLADLKKAIDNITKCTELLGSDKQIAQLAVQFSELKTLYNELTVNQIQKNTSTLTKDGKLIVDGNSQYSMNEKQFELIKQKVETMRKQIIEKGVK